MLFRYSGQQALFPGMMIEAILLLLQSVCSFGCDVISFGRASRWKPIDRLCASIFVSWQFTKLFWLDMDATEWVIWCATLLVGVYCFKHSSSSLKSIAAKESKLNMDFRSYFWWHTAWHVSLPIGAAIWMFARQARLVSMEVAAGSQ